MCLKVINKYSIILSFVIRNKEILILIFYITKRPIFKRNTKEEILVFIFILPVYFLPSDSEKRAKAQDEIHVSGFSAAKTFRKLCENLRLL